MPTATTFQSPTIHHAEVMNRSSARNGRHTHHAVAICPQSPDIRKKQAKTTQTQSKNSNAQHSQTCHHLLARMRKTQHNNNCRAITSTPRPRVKEGKREAITSHRQALRDELIQPTHLFQHQPVSSPLPKPLARKRARDFAGTLTKFITYQPSSAGVLITTAAYSSRTAGNYAASRYTPRAAHICG